MLNGADADAEAEAGTGDEEIRPTGAVGESCSTCTVIVAGAIVAAFALASAWVFATLCGGETDRRTPLAASSSWKVRLRETITNFFLLHMSCDFTEISFEVKVKIWKGLFLRSLMQWESKLWNEAKRLISLDSECLA